MKRDSSCHFFIPSEGQSDTGRANGTLGAQGEPVGSLGWTHPRAGAGHELRSPRDPPGRPQNRS